MKIFLKKKIFLKVRNKNWIKKNFFDKFFEKKNFFENVLEKSREIKENDTGDINGGNNKNTKGQ